MKKIILFISLLAILLVSCTSHYDSFAQCLADKNVKMYGAFWCPHCTHQKELFEGAFDKVNYIECSLPDKSGQTEICTVANITSYPTWEFSFDSRVEGVLTLKQLSEKSGCPLP